MYVMAVCGDCYFDWATVKEAREWAKKVMVMEQESCTLYRMNKDGSLYEEHYDIIPYRRN